MRRAIGDSVKMPKSQAWRSATHMSRVGLSTCPCPDAATSLQGMPSPGENAETHTLVFHASATVCVSWFLSVPQESTEADECSNFRTNQELAEGAANSQQGPGVLSSNSVHPAGCPKMTGVHPALPWLPLQGGLSRGWVLTEPHTCPQLPPPESPGIRARVQTGAPTPGPCMQQTVAPSFGPRTHNADTAEGGDSLEHSPSVSRHCFPGDYAVGVGSGGHNK